MTASEGRRLVHNGGPARRSRALFVNKESVIRKCLSVVSRSLLALYHLPLTLLALYHLSLITYYVLLDARYSLRITYYVLLFMPYPVTYYVLLCMPYPASWAYVPPKISD